MSGRLSPTFWRLKEMPGGAKLVSLLESALEGESALGLIGGHA